MMRALQVLDSRKLAVVDLPEPPAPAPGEVQIRIGAVALNHIDVWGWRGMAFAKRKLPIVVGVEAAGTVDAIGEGVTTLAQGDTVAIFGAETCGVCAPCRAGRDNFCENVRGIRGFHVDGLARERVNLAARLAVKAPAGVGVVAAACAPVTYGTPEHMLFDNAKLGAGQTILVQAGGSGVGTAAIQLAKAAGATVITTVGSPDKIEAVRALGADVVFSHRETAVADAVGDATGGRGVDAVIDTTGGPLFADHLAAMAPDGRLVTCGAHAGEVVPLDIVKLFQHGHRILGFRVATPDEIRTSLAMALDGAITVPVDRTFPTAEAAAAHAYMDERQHVGKIVLVSE